MKKTYTILLFILLASPFSYGQAFKINADGKIIMNGQTGLSGTSPEIQVSSALTTMSNYAGLNLFNADKTLNNNVGINFLGYTDHDGRAQYASIKAVFSNRSSLSSSLSVVSSELHLITSNFGQVHSRFSIKPGADFSSIRYDFNTSAAAGLILETSLSSSLLYPEAAGSLGTSSSYWQYLYVENPYFRNTPVITSDYRQKNTIKEIDASTVSKLKKLQAVSYKLNNKSTSMSPEEINTYLKQERGSVNEAEYKAMLELIQEQEERDKKAAEQVHFGLLAQEVEKVFPEIVNYDERNDSYGIRYTELIPILIEAIKEQQNEIEELKNEIVLTRKNLDNNNTLNLFYEEVSDSKAVLFQNEPNPFSIQTQIRYIIPQTAKSASLILYTLDGTQIKNYPIDSKGEGSVLISASELKPGMYIYQLLVDNQEIATKKMIITN